MKELSGGYCSGVPPLPIPNREVKPACADGTAMQCGRVGSRHFFKPQRYNIFEVFFVLSDILCIFAVAMQRLKYILIWLKRIRHCNGFGIQSPTDYWFVRYVINEHWPYYQTEKLGESDDWLTRKVGRLYFRLANWRQPDVIEADGYLSYLQAGCRKAALGESKEFILISNDAELIKRMNIIYNKVRENTMVVIDGIHRNKDNWQKVVSDERTVVTFDLYYCGIVFFDKKRHKQNYIINF